MPRPNSGVMQEVQKGTYERNRKIYERYKEGVSLAQIAREHKITRQFVHAIVERLKERDNGPAK